MKPSSVAIVGSGIAGLGAARALVAAGLDVTVYEAAAKPGGHVHTVEVGGVAVDMGFIVCNRENYPLFFGLLAELGVATRPTTMAFSVSIPRADGGTDEWSSASLSAMFADRTRLADPQHWRFLARSFVWLRRAARDLARGTVGTQTVDEYLAATGTPRDVRDRFVVPLAAALWSLAPDRCGEFPAEILLRFLEQHGMLRVLRPYAWHTIVGGSRRYLDALLALLAGSGRFTLALSTPVTRIARERDAVTITTAQRAQRFDRVVVATHADTALALLADASPDERRLLGAFRYSTNRTVLHADRSFLPRLPAAHASWNYVADPDTARVSVTYSMTKLQGLPDRPYLVTLNPRREPREVLHEATFTHPQFDRAALLARRELPGLRSPRTYFAGAHFGFGFHEDGLRAGTAAAARLLAESRESR